MYIYIYDICISTCRSSKVASKKHQTTTKIHSNEIANPPLPQRSARFSTDLERWHLRRLKTLRSSWGWPLRDLQTRRFWLDVFLFHLDGTFWMFSIWIASFRSHIFCASLCSDVCSHSKAAYSLKESTFRKKLPRKLAPILLACCSWPPRRSSHSQNCLNTKKV